MDSMDKDFKNIIDEGFSLNNKKHLKVDELKYELIEYNKKLHGILKANRINFHNEVSFIMKIKKQTYNRGLLPVVVCFLCNKNYMKKFKNENLSVIVKGDIATYVLLKTNIEKFSDEIKCIQENKRLKTSQESENTEAFNRLETLISETYERCNCIYIRREQHRILDNNEEKYIRNFIYDNLKFKTIDHKIHIKKLVEGREEADEYLRDITKRILRFNEEEFIKEVEHVSEFYNILEEILNEEVVKDFERIISKFIYNMRINIYIVFYKNM